MHIYMCVYNVMYNEWIYNEAEEHSEKEMGRWVRILSIFIIQKHVRSQLIGYKMLGNK